MDEIEFQVGIDQVLDSLLNERLALLCGAGLSMAAPSSIPSADELAHAAKTKYDATYGGDREPLPESIDEQAQFFFDRGELVTVFLRTYVDVDVFSAPPNSGHISIADLMLIRGISTTVSTNVYTLIETAGTMLHGYIGKGVTRENVLSLPDEKSPLLKIHGCWDQPEQTVWAPGQVSSEPIRTRIDDCGKWLEQRLANRDLLIVGFSTDWDYLNGVLENTLGSVQPSRVVVVDPCESAEFQVKAPALYSLGGRAAVEFRHVRCRGDEFLEGLRVEFSRTFVRRALHCGADEFEEKSGTPADPTWLEPFEDDANVLWQVRRDLEGCIPSQPARLREPVDEPMLGLTLLELRALGAIFARGYWNLDGKKIRVIRAPNNALHKVEAAFANEVAPVVAPDIIVAVGAEYYALPGSIARGTSKGSVARASGGRWLNRSDAMEELSP